MKSKRALFAMGLLVLLGVLVLSLPVRAGEHKFWDAGNVALQGGNAAIQIADLVVTERALRHPGLYERNPWGQSRGARVTIATMRIGLPLGLSYAFHAAGWHKVERFVPVVFLVPSGVALGYNLRF
jgi:hypothetical protein